jgi:hypothetical protein
VWAAPISQTFCDSEDPILGGIVIRKSDFIPKASLSQIFEATSLLRMSLSRKKYLTALDIYDISLTVENDNAETETL